MEGVVLKAGAGEALFGERIVIKSDFEVLSITESFFPDARAGATPHLHRQHADSFYVLEGELAFLVHDEEKLLGPRACVCAPPEVVHGFRSTSHARFLNFHTPDGGFAENLRASDRGEPGGFDSFDAPPGTGLPASESILLYAGEGERLKGHKRVATIKLARDELALVEFELEPGFEGPKPHIHKQHVDSFYVVEGEAEFRLGKVLLQLRAGSFIAAPPGIVHSFSNPGPGSARLINVHTPSCDFSEYLHVMDESDDELDEATHAKYDVYEVE